MNNNTNTTEAAEYKYSGNFIVNHNTSLMHALKDNNKRRLFKRLRDCAESYVAKGYELKVFICDADNYPVISKTYQF